MQYSLIIIVFGITQKKQQNFAAFLTKLINLPDGKVLFKLLKLSKDETIYLGMDKMSFLFKVDFEQIPVFKQALIIQVSGNQNYQCTV